ncbi:MAG: DNA double-strand break repair nuclease NurA, partial [Candidatus Bathyarchaeota archaeon]|nr:DNA double-strand break repair nuclease NurA [Candidatus Bathyarchaeota archaeon]
MIEQLQYATTPKYNFPHSPEDLQLPKRFIELSIDSMKSMKGESFHPYGLDFPSFLDRQEDDVPTPINSRAFTAQLTPLTPISDDTPIVAIDVSSIKIGETQTGILCALRGAIVWSRKMTYRHLRLGPFPFHINEENKNEIIGFLNQNDFSTTPSSSLADIQAKLFNLMEKWVQMLVCSSSSNSVILWDGSLTAGTINSPSVVISHLLRTARQRSNSVLAFSKVSKLRFLGRKIASLVWDYPPPWIFEVYEGNHPSSLHCLGGVYIARFRRNGFSFRLDIDRKIPSGERIRAAQQLLGNDLTFQSYPESLRLAHIYSTFTASEVIG